MLLQTRNKERAKLTGFVKHYFSYSCWQFCFIFSLLSFLTEKD
jgi:hypothetical protein